MEKIIEEYLRLQEKAANISVIFDPSAKRYNRVVDKLHVINEKIKERDDYEDIFRTIIELSPGEKYAELHCFIAGSIHRMNPEMSKQIYLKYKNEPISKHVLKEFFGIDVDGEGLAGGKKASISD